MLREMLTKIIVRALAPCALVVSTASLIVSAQTPSRRQTRAPQPQTASQSNRQNSRRAAQSSTPNQSPQSNAQSSTSNADDANADLSITAHVTARELRFEKVPNPKVEFTGKPQRETVWEAERENLPGEVQPGVTYRNIGIRLRITSVFADIDRIVAEALGEIPTSDDTQPATAPPAPPASQEAQTTQTSSATQTRAPQTDAPKLNASKTSPASASAATTMARSARHTRKGRGN
jgi:hypothetical protein